MPNAHKQLNSPISQDCRLLKRRSIPTETLCIVATHAATRSLAQTNLGLITELPVEELLPLQISDVLMVQSRKIMFDQARECGAVRQTHVLPQMIGACAGADQSPGNPFRLLGVVPPMLAQQLQQLVEFPRRQRRADCIFGAPIRPRAIRFASCPESNASGAATMRTHRGPGSGSGRARR